MFLASCPVLAVGRHPSPQRSSTMSMVRARSKSVPQRFAHRRSRRHVTPSTTRQKPESPDSWLARMAARCPRVETDQVIRPACHRSAVPCPAGLNACRNRGSRATKRRHGLNCATRNSQGTSATTSSLHPPHTQETDQAREGQTSRWCASIKLGLRIRACWASSNSSTSTFRG